ncbi:bifunctional proline dehydrogenase/L-glutamate gamma-semialdehyde dehydrogenase PutA [Aquabacterium sp. CECT 9606]|uniref:bifunctional proline dehydrogenase/L-glutamate gamma-semialdehyde dehydrogenase PutA n=1 Tax=Aquabacterium sp. CECT 9606 TaxID=2845822 RepID=UPI001E632019|nr:bifunctional proline dehydrogenase/L-glutamate gamma-semialdehyde dehydrogenase PutA [Aquabacterium sp. CECT 9606]CAH0350114.1 Bifunctional protein PutA [Aquabacterium sp. CECT 9606]
MNKLSDRLPLPWADEAAQIDKLRLRLQDKLDWGIVRRQCEPWVRGIRHRPPPFWALESLLQEFPLSSTEGLALMRLAEALLRVPDQDTAQALIGDQLTQADFAKHADHSSSAHPWLSSASARVLDLAHQLLPSQQDGRQGSPTLVQRLGGPTVVSATARALQLLGRQFVLGQTMDEALVQARKQTQADADHGLITRHSFDMLGEGARTWHDADRYLSSYQRALSQLGQQGDKKARQLPFSQRPGLSIKLSALHPRFDPSQHEALVRELLPRLEQLARQADVSGVLLTLDAEESFRLELQLDLLARLMPAAGDGLGLAVQAYQHRALAMIDEVHRLATLHDKRLTVRLVKGAYWDTEIKRAQELGLNGYPVYTHKANTDLSYLACADALLARSDVLYPQFATHNAATIAAVMQLAQQHGVGPERYEWQRLHGMGEGVYRELRHPKASPETGAALRIYAPVGEHRDLLAYLVRRLLENGANASFVHQLADPQVSLDELLASPWLTTTGTEHGPGVVPPARLYGPDRRNAIGRDLNCQMHRDALAAAVQVRRQQSSVPSPCHDLCAAEAQALMDSLNQGWQDWEETPASARCAVLDKAANLLEAEFDSWAADLVVEARKTMSDAVAEVRETIDLARYYAQQGRHHLKVQVLPGPTGESNEWQLRGRGVFVCIAPWNFPLAIFGGQVMAALVAGNAVAAKPADQTPDIARRFVALLHQAGVPADVLGCACGPGAVVGAALVASKHCAGVAFTGSVATGKRIQRMLAQGDRPIVPLIAETGGLNAMVVDSTALPEQVMDAVVASAFLSAGQRCSALRLLCLHSATADTLEAMLAGALQTLVMGDSADWATDVGPVIDAHAHDLLHAHLSELDHQAQQPRSGVRLIGQTTLAASATAPHIVPPTAYTLPRVNALTAEHFGPILHVVRWGPGTHAPDIDALIEQINATGYGLTLGVQTRIDSRAQHIARRSRVGNVYVNRGMTGAVVGSQPFGGQGWSGTGPKAGGPHYLLRFCTEQVVSINTAAAGGNAALLTQGH